MKEIKRKIITVLIAIALIFIVSLIAFGGRIKKSIENGEEINLRWFLALIYPDKYAYSDKKADYKKYFNLENDQDIAIILGDEMIEDKALLKDGVPYFTYNTIKNTFTNRFYVNENENVLLYTTSTDVIKVNIGAGEKGYYVSDTFNDTDYTVAFYEGENLYIAADYVKKYANFSYTLFKDPNRMQVNNKWAEHREATIKKKTKVRLRGGIKGDILTSVKKGDKVVVLEVLENWVKVRTNDGYIGYVEKKRATEPKNVKDVPVTDAYSPENDYAYQPSNEKITIAWHQIYFADDGANLNSLVGEGTPIDVVAPTWFYINSETGTFTDYSSGAYVENAHQRGLKVWALVEDMTNEFDEYALFSSSVNRKAFINNLITSVTNAGADGINIDCEKIGSKTGPHFVQFLRELSIETRKRGLVLSVDNYQPNEGNLYYNLKEQGLVCDYVVIMGYDEHWGGCETAGSVASIDFVENGIKNTINKGVPANKIINGVPFYTRLWKTEGVQVSSQALGMADANEWMSGHGITPVWDDSVCQNVCSRQDGTALYEMWVEDAMSIEAKLSVMDNLNVAGVACWKLGFETNDIWDVISSHGY